MKDILLTTDDDLNLVDGDFFIGDSILQNQKRLIHDNKNDWKQHPTACVGLFGYLSDERPDALFAEIIDQLTADGQTIQQIAINKEGNIQIDAQ